MKAPNPLPVAGDWIVTADGSQYEVRHCAPEHCTVTLADDEGVFFWSTDEGMALWAPWEDVERIEPAAPVASRYVLTITHTEAVPSTPAFLDALADVIRASMAAAGIPGGATITVEPAP